MKFEVFLKIFSARDFGGIAKQILKRAEMGNKVKCPVPKKHFKNCKKFDNSITLAAWKEAGEIRNH